MNQSSSLSSEHKSAWVSAFVSVHRVLREIERCRVRAGVIPFEIYDVLITLEDSPAGEMRLGELAERSLLSRSGLTRLIDRLQMYGYVTRRQCSVDRRVHYASITELGLEERRRAWPVYEAALAEHFAPHFNRHEARSVAEILGRIVPSEYRRGS